MAQVKLDDNSQYKLIVERFRESLSSLSELHQEFKEYDDFYLAKQWNKERASWRPDPVINYVSYVVDQKAPQITNNRPAGLILPQSQDDEEAAKAFTQVCEVVADRVDLDDKVDQVVRTGLLLGTGFFKVYWDNSLSGGNPQRMNVWKGDVAIDVPDPSNIYPDPSATTIEDCRYIIYAVPKTTKWVEEKFGIKVDSEQSFDTEVYNRPQNTHGKDRVMFYEYWTRDKNGVHCIYAAGGKVLKRIEKVFKHGRYPFVPFVAKKNRMSLWGIGEPKNIISNQKLLNKMYEMQTVHTLLTANPIALVDAQSGIEPSNWKGKPGMVQKVRDVNNSVRWLQPPTLGADVPKLAQSLTEFIERIAGIYDANTGETPGGVTAAAAIQMLMEQGSIPLKGISRNLHQALKDVYELMIELVKENYTETRYLRIMQEDGTYEFIQFNALQFAEVDFDVKVSAGASTPTSKAFIAQLASDLFDKQVLLPSEYVDMQEGLPNKDKIVARLREQEAAPPQQPNAAPMGAPQTQGFDIEAALQMLSPEEQESFLNAPPELKEQMIQQIMAQQPQLIGG